MKKNEFISLLENTFRKVLREELKNMKMDINEIEDDGLPSKLNIEAIRESFTKRQPITTNNLVIKSYDTTSEGSSLPEGEMSDDMILRLMKGNV